jgi:hypothetical protein
MAVRAAAARTQSFIELLFLFEYISLPDLSIIGLWLRNFRRYERKYLRVNPLNTPAEMMQDVLHSKLGGCSVKH